MFDNLTSSLTNAVRSLIGQGRLTESNIQDALRAVRVSLLEADVALPVATKFLADVEQKAIGEKVIASLRPGETLVKIVHDELVTLMGEQAKGLNLSVTPPAVILIVGLQGSGKTTTIAKLGQWLQKTHNKKVMFASADIYRPAAREQLEILASQTGATYCAAPEAKDPVAIATSAVDQARKQFQDVVLIDTAGRLHIDDAMMLEAVNIHNAINPIETLLVVDSMTGQDAVNIAKTFAEKLPLTGIILTKADGDARGGAALSMRAITGQPIKFIGTGEKMDALELFYPERMASRILGMGDILTLVEEAQQKIDHKKAEKLAKKLQKGKAFDLEDFREQLGQLRKMGGIANLLGKLPAMGKMQLASSKIDNKMFVRMEAIINSMTMRERRFPALINGSRKKRIAGGSGTNIQDVNKLLRQFDQMQKMMKHLKGNKLAQQMASQANFM